MRRVSVSFPLLACALVVALVVGLGSVGVSVAKPGFERRAVKKIAANVVKKKAKKLSVAHAATADDASNLGGLPPSAYTTTAYTVDIPTASNVASFDRTLPVVPAGTYQASVYLTAALANNNAELFCALYQEGQTSDLIDVYGNHYQSFRTVAATKVITVSGRLHLYCRTTNGTITAVPANPTYAPAQVSLLRIGTASPLGAAARQGLGRTVPQGAP